MLSDNTDANPFVTTCSEDEDGNLILDIPEILLDTMGWGEGTVLDLSVEKGRLILKELRHDSEET